MKRFCFEFIALFLLGLALFGIFDLFTDCSFQWDINIYTSLGMSAVYCIYKAAENGYGDDAVDD